MIPFRKFLRMNICSPDENRTLVYDDLNKTLDDEISLTIQNSDNTDDYDELAEMARQLSEETVADLKHLNQIDMDESIDAISIPKYETSDEIKNVLRKVTTTYGVCAAYLGAKRMNILTDILNRYLTLLSHRTDAEKENYKKLYNKIHLLMLLKVKVTDNTGRTDISLRKVNNRFEIVGLKLDKYEPAEPVNEDFASSIRSLWSKGRNVIPQVWRKLRNMSRIIHVITSGRTKGRRIDKSVFDNLYNCTADEVPEKSGNAEKRKLGVSWVKRITQRDLLIMNDTDGADGKDVMNDISIVNLAERMYTCGFFKALVLVSVKYGPAANNFLFDKLNNINK